MFILPFNFVFFCFTVAVEKIEQVVMNHSVQNGPPPSQPRQSRFKMGPPQTSLPPPSILPTQFTSVPPPMINIPSQVQSPTIAVSSMPTHNLSLLPFLNNLIHTYLFFRLGEGHNRNG